MSRIRALHAIQSLAALSNNDAVVDGALKQAGIVRVEDLQHMTVAAKTLQLPPLKGERLAVISMSEPEMVKMFGDGIGTPEQMLDFARRMSREHNKPIGLSFFSERRHIEDFKRLETFPLCFGLLFLTLNPIIMIFGRNALSIRGRHFPVRLPVQNSLGAVMH